MEEQKNTNETTHTKTNRNLMPIAIIMGSVLIAGAVFLRKGDKSTAYTENKTASQTSAVQNSVSDEEVIPSKGVVLPITWGDLGARMVEDGVIDKNKFDSVYSSRGGLSESEKKIVYGKDNKNITITNENAGLVLNLLWALGLSNKSPILENGPMKNPAYGGAGNFASTGGWTLSNGSAMSHYSKHLFIKLTAGQEDLVEKVSKNIYRPCCDNPVYFPDCNHGMAMLGLLELMASQGASENDMYKAALEVNSYWFPGTYLTVANFLKSKRVDWKDVDPKNILGPDYSSASGYKNILNQTAPQNSKGGGGCSV